MSIRLNPLSAARGAKFPCELCGQPSTLACAHCRVTYYCSKQHQSIDWAGIHERICMTLASLRNPPESFNSEEERQRRQLAVTTNQQALIELSKNEASKLLVQGQFELSIPPALQCLKLSNAVYGKGHVELVPSYLLLAEANMGLRRFAQAEKFLLLAQWGIFKNPNEGQALKSPLFRLFGKIYLAQGLLGQAAEHLVQDIYYSSLHYGSEHYCTAAGYYQMGLIFLKQDQIDNCLAFLDKVVDIWFKFLTNFKQQRGNTPISSVLSDTIIGEAADILRSVIETRVEFLGNGHIATAEASYVLGMLCQLMGHQEKALELLFSALNIYEVHVGADHDLTKEIRIALADVEGKEFIKKEGISVDSPISVPS